VTREGVPISAARSGRRRQAAVGRKGEFGDHTNSIGRQSAISIRWVFRSVVALKPSANVVYRIPSPIS